MNMVISWLEEFSLDSNLGRSYYLCLAGLTRFFQYNPAARDGKVGLGKRLGHGSGVSA